MFFSWKLEKTMEEKNSGTSDIFYGNAGGGRLEYIDLKGCAKVAMACLHTY
jgi:hypothetical protein